MPSGTLKVRAVMFRKRWPWLGKLVSDEGFEISFAHKSVYYHDSRGKFELGYEDGLLSATPYQVAGQAVSLSPSEIDQMVERVVMGIKSEDLPVQVYEK
jgi:hypothetical protein